MRLCTSERHERVPRRRETNDRQARKAFVPDRREYLIRAVKARRKKIRDMAIAYKGGRCEACSYDRCPDAFEFHHLDPAQKDFAISAKGYTRSWTRVKMELDKCRLLCANCHREAHAKLAASGGNAGMNSGLSQENPTRTILS